MSAEADRRLGGQQDAHRRPDRLGTRLGAGHPLPRLPDEIRRIVYTTNTVESLHAQIRKTIKARGHFPNDEAALRLIWLAVTRAKTSWRSCYNWTNAMSVLRIHFEDRIPD